MSIRHVIDILYDRVNIQLNYCLIIIIISIMLIKYELFCTTILLLIIVELACVLCIN